MTSKRDRPTIDADRDEATRVADHAAIDRLADDLLPALVAKLGASRLGEIEVREGPWKVRLRAPASAGSGQSVGLRDRRSSDRVARLVGGHPSVSSPSASIPSASSPSASSPSASPVPMGSARDPGTPPRDGVATSPAVGIFQPRPDLRPGMRVRAGDRLGSVDVLGVRQEVVSPIDGLVGGTLVDVGDAVEYGQALIRVEAGV